MNIPNINTSTDRESLSAVEVMSASETNTHTLLPLTYRNEMFDQNLAYLKDQQPALFEAVERHRCEEYRLCSNPDGSPNILHMPSKILVYSASSLDEIMAPIRNTLHEMFSYTHLNEAFLGSGSERWRNNNPIQVRMLDNLYVGGIFNEIKLTARNLAPLRGYCSDYFPLLRVYGIGLGYHLTELIKQKNISYITVYEPHFDLFYTSLYTIPWQLIFKYFGVRGKGINLALATTPDAAIDSNMAFIKQRLMPLTSHFYRFNHYDNFPPIKEIIEKEPQTDTVHRHQSDAGWYEDQRIGFYYSARNIKKGNRFFSGQQIKRHFRAFIIGTGPSLNEAIDYLKTHQEEAIIISCGSAITPLEKAGIIPDYQIVQERLWHFPKHEEKHDLDLLKKVSLLKLNVVSPKIDKHYKETLVFQKFKDPGSSMLGDNFAVTTAVNPTVTNAGISIAAELGVNEVYLFGVDYGAPEDSLKMHAANTFHDEASVDDSVESKAKFNLPGNLGTVIRTTSVFSWSLKTTEQRIKQHPNTQWFNVGEGALIEGAAPVAVQDLPAKFPRKIQKQRLRKEISDCFINDYSPDNVLTYLKTHHMKQVDEYFQALLGFTESVPKTREEAVNVLSLMYQAVTIGSNDTDFLPSSLLSYGFKQFINNVYIQIGLAADDASAARFFEVAKSIMTEYIEDIENDLTRIMNYIENESETELIKTW